MASMSARQREIQDIHTRYADFYRIGSGIALVLLGVAIGHLMFAEGYATNVYTETLSVIVTILVLDRLNDWRARHRAIEERKHRLIHEAGSQSNETAKTAVEWLRAEGWLLTSDGLRLLQGRKIRNAKLQGADLSEADLNQCQLVHAQLTGADLQLADLSESALSNSNLTRANLMKANLTGAVIRDADLEGADFSHSNLQNTDLGNSNFQSSVLSSSTLNHSNLRGVNLQSANLNKATLQYSNLSAAHLHQANLSLANLQNADLRWTSFQDADLWSANLSFADLRYANFQNANLANANLLGAKIDETWFNEKTVLPDAIEIEQDEDLNPIYDKYWTPETDMSRYTDPNHTDFWQPQWAKERIMKL